MGGGCDGNSVHLYNGDARARRRGDVAGPVRAGLGGMACADGTIHPIFNIVDTI